MRKDNIEKTLRDNLHPMHIEVVDESHMHSVGEGAQSHFKVTLVSEAFDGKMLVARHREVNRLLASEFDKGLHALALHTMTPEEWFAKGGAIPDSPPCLGGSKATG
jgi:BolA protein